MLWTLSFAKSFWCGSDSVRAESAWFYTRRTRNHRPCVHSRTKKKILTKDKQQFKHQSKGVKGDQSSHRLWFFEMLILLRIATRCRQVWSIGRFTLMVVQVQNLHFTINVSMLCGKKRHTKKRPLEEFPKAFGYKSGPRNTIFRFASERPGDGSKNSLKTMQTKKETQKEVLVNLIKWDIPCLQK